MELIVKQYSSLVKMQTEKDLCTNKDCYSATVLRGEHFAYQVVLSSKKLRYCGKCEMISELEDCIEAYLVENAVMDFAYPENADEDYIAKDNGTMPDILIPLKERGNIIQLSNFTTIWLDINIPKDCKPGIYTVVLKIKSTSLTDYEGFETFEVMKINVLDVEMPKQKTLFTQWFHTDCIASTHKVEIYSEKHWELIDKYMKMAANLGINMILTPIITPHFNVAEGTSRPNVQLVDIEKDENGYTFDFSRLKRWINMAKENGINYFEMAPFFSQWGLKYTPNIVVKENGNIYHKFGWHVSSEDKEYEEFLKAFIPELICLLKQEGICENTYFHLSDEPTKANLEKYKFAYEMVKPLIGDCKIMEACSEYDFIRENLMDVPVACTNSIDEFLDKDVKELFAYYCCTGSQGVSNRFMAMPAYRNRIMGIQMYKYDIKGFLQWGYNFYYNKTSEYLINPYVTTSADKAYPSGDSFSVYPGEDGPICSTRGLVFKDALQDIELLKLLEKYIGKTAVVELIEKEAGMEITFRQYPKDASFIFELTEKVKKMIAQQQKIQVSEIERERNE